MLKSLWLIFVFFSITLACDPVYHNCCWNNRCVDNSGCETNQRRRGKDDCNKGTLNAQKCSDDLSNKCGNADCCDSKTGAPIGCPGKNGKRLVDSV
ncbi:hypothetical protein EG327_007349 [Venturia inaequalis]|uniref:Uncharacterized protein n=1 Tax=Venturia inaequalis TaxID=5025 RepID=A0A8H3Z3K7_VENIN|nr:hypothetical protein EG327_007349 [Venturia inaequalis]